MRLSPIHQLRRPTVALTQQYKAQNQTNDLKARFSSGHANGKISDRMLETILMEGAMHADRQDFKTFASWLNTARPDLISTVVVSLALDDNLARRTVYAKALPLLNSEVVTDDARPGFFKAPVGEQFYRVPEGNFIVPLVFAAELASTAPDKAGLREVADALREVESAEPLSERLNAAIEQSNGNLEDLQSTCRAIISAHHYTLIGEPTGERVPQGAAISSS